MPEDEKATEQPVSEPSTEEKATEEPTSEKEKVEGEKTVPYERFKAVIDERNTYKELLQTQGQALGQPKEPIKETSERVAELETQTGQSYDDAIKIIDQRVESKLQSKVEAINRQMDLDRAIRENTDFFKFADQIKGRIAENPHLGWSEAYKLVKFDANMVETAAKAQAETEKKAKEAQKASVESAKKSKPISPSGNIEDFDSMAKGPDGKFLYSTKELEEILPKAPKQ